MFVFMRKTKQFYLEKSNFTDHEMFFGMLTTLHRTMGSLLMKTTVKILLKFLKAYYITRGRGMNLNFYLTCYQIFIFSINQFDKWILFI